jgi:hypothetical protein
MLRLMVLRIVATLSDHAAGSRAARPGTAAWCADEQLHTEIAVGPALFVATTQHGRWSKTVRGPDSRGCASAILHEGRFRVALAGGSTPRALFRICRRNRLGARARRVLR